jgi:hypothetical protein
MSALAKTIKIEETNRIDRNIVAKLFLDRFEFFIFLVHPILGIH